jgi:ureidoacrylate peracid hydrolase
METKGSKRSLCLPCRYYRNYPSGEPLGYNQENLVLRLDETVFLLIDVYGLGYDDDENWGNAPDFYKKFSAANREIVRNHIRPAQIAARKAGLPIVYLTNYLAPSTTKNSEWIKLGIRSYGEDALETWREPTDALRFSKIIAPEQGDFLFKKQHYSGFFETHLESLLKELGTRTLVTVGFDGQICLRATVTDALFRNYRVIVLRDCVRAMEYVETEREGWNTWLAIRFIESEIGYTSTSQEFIQAWDSGES